MCQWLVNGIFPERQRWPIGLPGAWAQSHHRREHSKDKMCFVTTRTLCQRCFLLWVDIQSLQYLQETRGTITIVWKPTLYGTLLQPARGGRGGCGPGIPRSLQHGCVTRPLGDITVRKLTLWKVAILGICGWTHHLTERTDISGWSDEGHTLLGLDGQNVKHSFTMQRISGS